MGATCGFVLAWVGECGEPAYQGTDDPVPLCGEHMDETCVVCGSRAMKECSATMGLVCGAPLCEEHGIDDCTFHN